MNVSANVFGKQLFFTETPFVSAENEMIGAGSGRQHICRQEICTQNGSAAVRYMLICAKSKANKWLICAIY